MVLPVALAGCGDGQGSAKQSAEPSTEQSSTPASPTGSSPTSTPAAETSTPSESPSLVQPPVQELVYYLVDDPTGVRLAREPHELPATDDPGTTAAAAVEAMVAGPDDPDYATTWDPDTRVLGVTDADGTVTVDLSGDAARTSAGPDAARLMQQQLVYTVTEVLGHDAAVRLLLDGKPVDELWGGVRWSRPVRREDPMTVRDLVQIDTPAEGASSGRRVQVSGEAATFEATVRWRVVDATGGVVRSGFTTAAEGMTLSPYSFTVRLRPGTYTVEVSEDDASGGEGEPPRSDTRSFTVG